MKIGTAPFILAISGGPDSVYLLHTLLKKGQRPILAHLNHQLRGAESDGDEAFVRKLATQYNCTLEVESIDVASYARTHKMSIETAGRQLRYKFLERVREKHKAQAIFTAHHENDNMETILMNRERGAGLRGQLGMEKQRGYLVRPLLHLTKKQILAYLHKNNILYRVDSSNQDMRYYRNRARQKLANNPALYNELKRTRRIALVRYKTLKKWARTWNTEHSHFPLAAFTKLNMEKQCFLLQDFYEKAHGSTLDLTSKQVEEVRCLLVNGKTGKMKRFGKNLIVRIEYKYAIFEPKAKTRARATLATLPLDLTPPLDLDLTRLQNHTLRTRSWQPGDRFQPSGMQGTKKLQDYFTDNKTPPHKRHQIPVWVTEEDTIVAVGNRVDERYRTPRIAHTSQQDHTLAGEEN